MVVAGAGVERFRSGAQRRLAPGPRQKGPLRQAAEFPWKPPHFHGFGPGSYNQELPPRRYLAGGKTGWLPEQASGDRGSLGYAPNRSLPPEGPIRRAETRHYDDSLGDEGRV